VKNSTKILIVIGIVAIALIMGSVGMYNNLVTQSESVENSFSQVETQLQRRNDLIPNLVETVQRYADHEEEIFTEVAEARSRLMGAGSVEQQAEADAELSGALSRLLAISENYPELRANENFINLQDELAGTENRISTARRDYNETVRSYNTAIRRFPTNIFAGMFNFDSADYFEAEEGATENPDVGELFGD